MVCNVEYDIELMKYWFDWILNWLNIEVDWILKLKCVYC